MGGDRRVMVSVIGNGYIDVSSNPFHLYMYSVFSFVICLMIVACKTS